MYKKVIEQQKRNTENNSSKNTLNIPEYGLNSKDKGEIISDIHKKKYSEIQKNLNNNKSGGEVIYFNNIKEKLNMKNNLDFNDPHYLGGGDKLKTEEDIDSDEEAFNEKNEIDINKQIVKNDDEDGEELSSLTNTINNEEIEKDFLYTQYEKVHRVKTKWKCIFRDAILQISGKEYIFDKITAELERDW